MPIFGSTSGAAPAAGATGVARSALDRKVISPSTSSRAQSRTIWKQTPQPASKYATSRRLRLLKKRASASQSAPVSRNGV